MPIRQIACAVDFSPLAERAARFASELARAHGASLHLVHVVPAVMPTVSVPEIGLAVVDAPLSLPEQMRDAEAALDRLAAQLDVETAHHVVVGSAASELVRFVAEQRIDLVVLGTHARTGIAHWLLGSVSEQVTRQVHVPVVIVPPCPSDAAKAPS